MKIVALGVHVVDLLISLLGRLGIDTTQLVARAVKATGLRDRARGARPGRGAVLQPSARRGGRH
jgi:hypothetical protein